MGPVASCFCVELVSYVKERTYTEGIYNFYHCTMHFEIYVVHSSTNALFINLVKSIKFTLKYIKLLLLHFSVFNDHNQVTLLVSELCKYTEGVCE